MLEEEKIIIRGARENNLKDVSLDIPTKKLVVITGPSGSGKSSLAFDTIFAEGQRRYLESLSAYARQFLDQMTKPDIDFIDGLSPAIAIEQKTINTHPRSSVGTVTNIYDFVRLLFAKVGKVKDPSTGETLKAHSDDDIIDHIKSLPEGKKFRVYASVVRGRKGEFLREIERWKRLGYSKAKIDGEMKDLHDPILLSKYQHHDIDLMIDLLTAGKEENTKRVREAIKVIDRIAEGWMKISLFHNEGERSFSRKLSSSAGATTFPELEPRLFSFNSPFGMCKSCKGTGIVAIEGKENILSDDEADFENYFENCSPCEGTGLRSEALWVNYNDYTIKDFLNTSACDLRAMLEKEVKKGEKHPVALRLIEEINTRLEFLDRVGISYLSLGRKTRTLSGGEAQRVRLATQLGSQLSGVLYVLDEPSIGLHHRDHNKLLNSLYQLRDLGNSVIVVEHDEDTMLASDHIIDIGPGAGIHGGTVINSGKPSDFKKMKSVTSDYLYGRKFVSEQRSAREGNGKFIEIKGCTGNNLKNVDLKLPLGQLVAFSGVSGSGKSSLVRETLEVAISRKLYRSQKNPLPFKKIVGLENINKMVHVDQKPIGRTPRSNPATYTGLFSLIRNVFAASPDAKLRGFTASTFSFNIKGGRCDNCEGAGKKRIEMHFLPDVFVECETCFGQRYRREVLEVRYKGRNIAEVLNMSVNQAYEHFANQPQIAAKLKTLAEVGLGYLKLGQSSVTLSGGEAQRIKLSKELSKRSTGKTLYFLDEPTTGLHFDDVKKLLDLVQRLCDQGNSIVIIEHNLDVIASADHVVDIGPSSGGEGGEICFQGPPSKLKSKNTPSGIAMKEYFSRRKWK